MRPSGNTCKYLLERWTHLQYFLFSLSRLPYACPLLPANQGTFHFCTNPMFPHLYWGCHCEQFVFLNVPWVNFSLPGKCLLQEVTLDMTHDSIPVPNCRHLLSQFYRPWLYTVQCLFFTSFLKISTPEEAWGQALCLHLSPAPLRASHTSETLNKWVTVNELKFPKRWNTFFKMLKVFFFD